MLMLFPTVKVPGLDDIEIFRDHEKDDTFYALRGKPKIAIDPDTKAPLLSYNMFSRNADIAYASSSNKELVEAQLGQLLFTTDLAVTEEEHKKIVEYLEKISGDTSNRFNRLYTILRRKRSGLPAAPKKEIKLGNPNTWKEGTAKLELLEGLGDTFKKSSSAEVRPALVGSNSAAFYATFGIEGSQIFFDALTKGATGKDKDNLTPLQAIVRYELKGFAFVPSLEVKVTANSTQVFEQFKSYKEDYEKRRRGTRTTVSVWPFYSKTTDNRSLFVDKSNISEMVQEMIDKKIINIEITDYGDISANEDKAAVEEGILPTIMEMIMNTIIPNFFQSAFIGQETPPPPTDGSTPATPPPNPFGGNPAMGVTAEEMNRPNVEMHYYFEENIEKTKINTLNFNFKKNGTVEFRRYPNATLIANLSEEQIKSLVKFIDVSSPEVQILEVQVGVNADFDADNIHSIIVQLSYRQQDFKTKTIRENSKSYLFKKGDEGYIFRVTMARNEQGALIDFYTAEAKISYKGTADSPPPIKLENISDRALVISYDKLGFVTVNIVAGDIDWKLIKEAIVQLVYKPQPDKPDTKKDIVLSEAVPNGSWRTYMYGNKSREYTYKTKFIYLDGREIESDERSDTKDTLKIDDLLTGRIKASFDVIMDAASVKTAKVEIAYSDEAKGIKQEDYHWFTGTETWDWVIRQQEGASDKFKYRYFVQYLDGIVFTSPWTESASDEDIPPISLGRKKKTLTIDGGLLDWSEWKVVYATVEYKEPDNNYSVSQNLRLDSQNIMQSLDVFSFANEGKPFVYNLQFANVSGAITKSGPFQSETGLVILEAPESPAPEPASPTPPEPAPEPVTPTPPEPAPGPVPPQPEPSPEPPLTPDPVAPVPGPTPSPEPTPSPNP